MKNLLYFLSILTILFFLIFQIESFEPILKILFPKLETVIYNRSSIWTLTINHLFLVFSTSILAVFVSVAGAIFVTSEVGKDFLPITRNLTNIGQIFPPIAVLAISIPIFGFGFYPTAISLLLYGILPIFENTISGIQSINPNVILSAKGMGMNSFQLLYKVKLPLAFPFIFTGFRISVIINLGTATIGSMVAAKSLGEIIIAGILVDNQSFILQGSIIIAFLAILLNFLFEFVERNYLTHMNLG